MTLQAKMTMPDFQLVPLKALSGQIWLRYPCFFILKPSISTCGFSKSAFLLKINNGGDVQNENFSSERNNDIFKILWSSKGFQEYCCEGSFKITLSVPLTQYYHSIFFVCRHFLIFIDNLIFYLQQHVARRNQR